MPYTPVNFQDGVTPLNAATLNKLDDALEDLYTNPAAALTYEGDYVPATSYQDGDMVVKDGIAYLCVGGPTTTAPSPVPWGPAGMMSGYIKTTDKDVANGVASLDANARVPTGQLRQFVGPNPPGSPLDGDEWIYNVGVLWRFRYMASEPSAYKWHFAGGQRAVSTYLGVQPVSPANTWVTGLPQLTIPRTGEYLVSYSSAGLG